MFLRLLNYFSGRTTLFAVVFSVVGIILAFVGKLTNEYVLMIGAIQTLVVMHSAKEDYFNPTDTKQQEEKCSK